MSVCTPVVDGRRANCKLFRDMSRVFGQESHFGMSFDLGVTGRGQHNSMENQALYL